MLSVSKLLIKYPGPQSTRKIANISPLAGWVQPLLFAVLITLICTQNLQAATNAKTSLIDWQDWSQKAFDKAKASNKLVLLNLEAVWCHWCHVMDQKTYSNKIVADIINKHYIAIKVDHDARPDLAQRYRDYGWPATIVLNADGTEIVKRAGYMSAENFSMLLQAIVKDPSPETAALHFEPEKLASSSNLSSSLKEQLIKRRYKTFDTELGGFKNSLKFLDRAYLEYAFRLARNGNQTEKNMAIKTLNSALQLIDPVWGGAYQYSTFNDWQHAHYEKIMTSQARNIELYAKSYALWKKPEHLSAAKDVARYLNDFLLGPNGAFYTSQDADVIQGEKSHQFFTLDDKARRKQGIPRIDKNQYAQENGWAITALATLYEVTLNEQYLDQAITAAQWVITNRRVKTKNNTIFGFHHGQSTEESLQNNYFLGDNLAMANAFLQLHRATAGRQWLEYAVKTTRFIDYYFKKKQGGFNAATSTLSPVPPSVNTDENIALVRLTNLLFHYTGQKEFKDMAEHGMRWLLTPAIALERIEESGILLADFELTIDPIHLTIVGYKDDKMAQQLYKQALQTPGHYKRIEWWDTREGPLPNTDIEYPVLKKSAAFVCTNGRCSLPSFTVEEYKANIRRLLKQ